MKNFGAAWGLGVVLACLSLGCSGDDASEAFVSRWLATHYASSDTCNGDTNSDDGQANLSEMELRAAGADAIEYVTFFDDGTTVGCTQRFQVRGSVASILPNQTCAFGEVIKSFPKIA